jgi:hypothetical protein
VKPTAPRPPPLVAQHGHPYSLPVVHGRATEHVAAERTKRDARPDASETDKGERLDPLDPATRRAAQLAAPQITPVTAPSPAVAQAVVHEEMAPRTRVSMEELLPQLVRRIAWAGDRRRGSVQLELGAGRHAGTTITVHADEGRVRVELDGAGAVELRSRIRTRLERHGLDVESVS